MLTRRGTSIPQSQSTIRNLLWLAIAVVPCAVVLSLAHGPAAASRRTPWPRFLLHRHRRRRRHAHRHARRRVDPDRFGQSRRPRLGRIDAAARQMPASARSITTSPRTGTAITSAARGPLSKLIPIRADLRPSHARSAARRHQRRSDHRLAGVSATPIFLSAGDSVKLKGGRGTPDPGCASSRPTAWWKARRTARVRSPSATTGMRPSRKTHRTMRAAS